MPFRMLQYVVRIWDRYLIDPQDLHGRPLTPSARMALLLLRIASGNTHLADDLRPWADDLRAILETSGGLEDFRALVTYIEMAGESPPDELRELFSQLGPTAEEAYMTTAEMLRAEGRAEGFASLAHALEGQLSEKFGPLPHATVEAVRGASPDQLATWLSRVLKATTLDEVLR